MDKILIVDDEPDIVTTWTMRLKKLGYEVITARDGQEGLAKMISFMPDIVLLDIVMPKVDGLQLCRTLKKDQVTARIPIVMLTARGTLRDKIEGIESGADDYITKDADPEEVEARINMVLRRYRDSLGANPLTKLPGNNVIEKQLTERIAGSETFAVGYADLDNFKAYNDIYGFQAGDEVITFAARVITDAVRDHGKPSDFTGHVGGDDFVFITSVADVDGVCGAVITGIDGGMPGFYSDEDRERGHIVTRDRAGVMREFPLVGISIAVVTNEFRPLESVGEIARSASELKKYLKSLPGSNYTFEQRIND